jgi:hypothetical protein
MPKNVKSSQFCLWILGAAGPWMSSIYSITTNKYPWIRIVGEVKSDEIDAAIIRSTGIILPIWEGGGSNLKTAQALLSNKCVIGSQFSFRGFESYINEPGVWLARDPENLAAIAATLNPQKVYTRSTKTKELNWSYIFEDLPEFIINHILK